MIPSRQFWIVQEKYRPPFSFHRLGRTSPGSTFLDIAGDYNGVICEGIDQLVAPHSCSYRKSSIWSIWRNQAQIPTGKRRPNFRITDCPFQTVSKNPNSTTPSIQGGFHADCIHTFGTTRIKHHTGISAYIPYICSTILAYLIHISGAYNCDSRLPQ